MFFRFSTKQRILETIKREGGTGPNFEIKSEIVWCFRSSVMKTFGNEEDGNDCSQDPEVGKPSFWSAFYRHKKPWNVSVRRFDSISSDSLKAKSRSILLTAERKSSGTTQKQGKLRLKKVHFLLPKTSSTKRTVQSLDPNATFVQHWLNITILPLSYEMWAFPYRLALGIPSTSSALCYADAIGDCFFLVDMFISLITALPATPGQEEVISFPGIAAHYFSKVFPYQILPCCVYWCLTPICAHNFESLCSENEDESSFECWIGSISWGLWVWWGASVLRFVPRLLRLLALFKNMESNLVCYGRIYFFINILFYVYCCCCICWDTVCNDWSANWHSVSTVRYHLLPHDESALPPFGSVPVVGQITLEIFAAYSLLGRAGS